MKIKCSNKCRLGLELRNKIENADTNYKKRRIYTQILEICAYCNFNEHIIDNIRSDKNGIKQNN